MLVGGAFVAVDGNALVHHFTVAIEALAQRFHHQLLEITAEHLEAIAVRQNNHVALTLAATGHVPRGSHQSCRIAAQVCLTGGGVHL